MKKIRRNISLLLCVGLLAAGVTTASAKSLSDITSDSIKDMQNQISKAEEEKKNLQNTISNIEKIKKELEAQKSDLKKYVATLDSNLEEIEENIVILQGKIADKEAEIAETEEALEKAEEVEAQQYEFLSKRIKLIYEQGDDYYLDLILSAKSFGDMLNKADFAQLLYDYDQRMWKEYQDNRQYIALCKENLEAEKEILDQAKANVEIEQKNMENLIDAKSKEIISYETDIANREKAIKEYEADIKAENELIASLEADIAEAKKNLMAQNGNVPTYDGGQFKFPLASYTRLSDDYGMRMHPTLGVEKFHNGIDLAAPKGTAIYAAYDGVVVAASYSSTMGNYVMIDHGDGLYTIYMHASALYVSKDDIVARGEHIAAVGSTGRSTGNHLHFGVRENGQYTSPWNYLSE